MNQPHSMKTILVEINNRAVSVSIVVYVEHDEGYNLSDLSDDSKEQKRLGKKIDDGSLMIAHVMVKASAFTIDGIDTLGGVFIAKPEDVEETISFHSMELNAINDLKLTMTKVYADLSQVMGA